MEKLTKAEVDFCMYKLDMSGNFKTKLYDLYWLADTFNKARLLLLFPNLRIAEKFSNEDDYWQDLVKKWNSQHTNLQLHE